MKVVLRLLPLLTTLTFATHAQVPITTESYDNNRTAANLSETILNTSNVNSGQFGKLFSWPVDAPVYAQPLYISAAPNNLLIVATMNDTVYAFNADSTSATAPLWTVSLIPPGASAVAASAVTSGENYIVGSIGVMSTPVYDPTTGTIYAVSFTQESSSLVYRLHALSVTNGAEEFGGPVVLAPSASGYTVTGLLNDQRSGLALANGQVYVAWASWGDLGDYHGMVASYSASTLQQTGVFNDTPTGYRGGIWMGGRAPAVDSNGSVYYATGDGTADNSSNFGESFVRFGPGPITALADWFTPQDATNLFENDLDMNAPLLVPEMNLVLGSGKDSILYVMNTTNMGKQASGDSGVVQEFPLPNGGTVLSGPAYDSSTNTLYIWPANEFLLGFHLNGGTFNTSPTSGTIQAPSGSHNPALAVSPGILWASGPDIAGGGAGATTPGILRAFDASTLAELYDSDMNAGRDSPGDWSKFRSPVVDNGRVYLASNSNQVNVYGLLGTGTSGGTGGSGGSGASGNAASLVGTDSTTSGNWHGVYGSDGFQIADSTTALPSYVTVQPNGANLYIWPSTDNRAPYTTATGTTRIASTWYTATSETFDVKITDGGSHQIAFYLLDFDNDGRTQTITVLDGDNGTTLIGPKSFSGFQNGFYAAYQISGHVRFVVTNTLQYLNASVSAIFFDSGTGGSGGGSGGGTASATISWSAVSGATSYAILRAAAATGPFTQVGTSATTSFTDTTVSHGTSYYYQIVPVVAVQ